MVAEGRLREEKEDAPSQRCREIRGRMNDVGVDSVAGLPMSGGPEVGITASAPSSRPDALSHPGHFKLWT